MKVCLDVSTGAMSSMPREASSFSISGAGRGVILSIIDQGKETALSSPSQAAYSAGANPFFTQASAISSTEARSFSPLWEQLSMLTRARGALPASYLSSIRAATTLMAWRAWAGPSAMSAWATGSRLPFMSRRA